VQSSPSNDDMTGVHAVPLRREMDVPLLDDCVCWRTVDAMQGLREPGDAAAVQSMDWPLLDRSGLTGGLEQ